MGVTIRRVEHTEIGLLCELDVKIFSNDGFESPKDWDGLETYFIVIDQEVVGIIDQQIIGSIAFRHHSDVSESYEAEYPYLHNSLYLTSIGILPEKQAMGLGSMAMVWLVDYARRYGISQRAGDGFRRIVSNARKSNLPSIKLHLRLGFKIIRVIPGYYKDPNGDAIVFELKL